ncbi:Methionyl-tRNA formyltransferase [Austwickia sp. TVS 96-490-7B]|uniref:methionyl-tRNA formyltransferase n=1 Tax=Austwickia sp. TVS 96-490-7B TaxID=2830843 RepID=UPI001C5A3F4D|nr:methionyl-tRNA formyltransferase [Austwickia sp. TVS 96-490-7B]MBW3086044.1 Methionyl-tRNA formyltransferase [Austwickia sp. TVS 96-490-7B]
MRLVFAGTPAVAVPALDALMASDHEVVAVVTRQDARSGRGRTWHPSPVKARAEELGLEVLTPATPRDEDFQARLRDLAPAACPVVAYGNLIPRPVLEIPTHGWINLHFSLLPAWRGAAPVQHAVIAGDDVTGASTFLLEEGLDTGPVLGRMTERIHAHDTAGDLLDRLAVAGAHLLVASLDALDSGQATPIAQPAEGISHAPKLTVDDARIRWQDPALAVDRRIRGCTPAPGAWTSLGGHRLKVGPVSLLTTEDITTAFPGDSELPAPGQIVATRSQVMVGTATTPVLLGEVQPSGKRAMSAADWARGARITAGTFFDLERHDG